MYKYFNFTKIYESLDAVPIGYAIEVVLTQSDIDSLASGTQIIKTDSNWKKIENQAEIIKINKLTINIDEPASATVINNEVTIFISQEIATRIITNLKGGGTITESINGITLNFIKSNDEVQIETQEDEESIKNESTMDKLLTFDQFVNEAKGKNWIADVVKGMDKGALKKDMGGKVTKEKIAKSEAALEKKDKDKKKPGLQLDAKDAKSHKRNVLAKNLLNAQKK